MGRAPVAACAITWLLYLPALVILALYFWAFWNHAWSVTSAPYQVDYGEAPELNRAVLLSRLQPIYTDWSHSPYQMANYTPLYPAVAAFGVKLAGVQFFTGRLISLASTLLTGVAIGAVAWALRAGPRGALLGGLLYFAMYPVWNWGAYQRVDAFAVALEWAGLVLFAFGWIRHRSTRAVWLTVPLFVAAAYARQTIAAGAFACYVYLLFRRPRLALAASGAYTLTGLALFALLNLSTGGQFYQHIVAGNVNRFSWDTVNDYWQPFWRLFHWMFNLAAAAVLLGAIRRQAQVPLLYLAAGAATALTIGKIGSSFNYLLQMCAALSLMAGLAVGHADGVFLWLARAAHRRLPRLLRPLAALVALGSVVPAGWLLVGLQQAYHAPYVGSGRSAVLLAPAPWLTRLQLTTRPLWRFDPWAGPPRLLTTYWLDRYRPNPLEGDEVKRVQQFVDSHPGDVLSEDMTFTVAAGRRIYVQPFEFTQLAEQGVWNQRPLLEDIRAQRFGVVILRFNLSGNPTWHDQRVNKPVRDAIAAAYRFQVNFGDYFLYVPR